MPRLVQLFSKHPSAALLFLQLISLLIYPILSDTHATGVVLTVTGMFAVLLAVRIAIRSPIVNWVSWILAVPAISLTLALNQFGYVTMTPWAYCCEAALYFYTAYGLVAYMLSDKHVTTDELYAVGATFTLLAWAFAYACMACQYWWPNSFTAATHPGDPRTWMEMLYFSFSVLSSTGLSDIMPIAAQARALVMLEMFMGVMYIALVVSRLVGLATARR